MESVKNMLNAHPQKFGTDADLPAKCVMELTMCAQACNTCADACLSEEDIKMLVRCIRLNEDCADICTVTAGMLSRHWETPDLVRSMLQTCILSCKVCGDECEKHGSKMEHCRICGESCRRCEAACNDLMKSLS